MCKYITQGKADGNSCGAFTLAYYEWEISGHAKAEAADRAYISALYNDIVFGCAMPGFESYSNPMLMMRRLAKQGAKPVFHLGENPLIDLRDLAGLHPYAQSRDVVACNPPYFTGGRVSPDTARAGARHELSCTMPDVCAAAGLLLKDGGRLCVCQRPERLADVLCAMRGARIEPKRLQFVMARPEKAPWLVLVEGQKNRAPGLRVPAPLVTARADGRPSAAMLEIYGTEPKKEAP